MAARLSSTSWNAAVSIRSWPVQCHCLLTRRVFRALLLVSGGGGASRASQEKLGNGGYADASLFTSRSRAAEFRCPWVALLLKAVPSTK